VRESPSTSYARLMADVTGYCLRPDASASPDATRTGASDERHASESLVGARLYTPGECGRPLWQWELKIEVADLRAHAQKLSSHIGIRQSRHKGQKKIEIKAGSRAQASGW